MKFRSKGIQRVAGRVGVTPDNLPTFSRGFTYYHRIDVPATGQQAFNFFNESRRAGITNLEQAGTLPAGTVFTVKSLRFSFLPGFDRLGNRLGITAAAPNQTQIEASLMNVAKFGVTAADAVVAANSPHLWAEKSRELLDQGEVIFTKGERLVTGAYGLTKYPSGRGVVNDTTCEISHTNSNASVVNNVGQVYNAIYNGAPLVGNVQEIKGDVSLGSGEQFAVNVGYQRTVSFAEQFAGPLFGVAGALVAGVLMCELDGILYTSAQ